MSVVYIDVMRMVTPGEALKESQFDFYLLGGFDAMKVQTDVGAIQELSERHKERHIEVPKHFERQPLYIYTPNSMNPALFSRDGDAAEMPLVLTLFQLDDFILEKTPHQLIEAFENAIDGFMPQEREQIVYQVFWNLGESDLVVVFRSSRLEPVGKLLVRLRSWSDEEHRIRVLSTCSHCAFPAPADGEFKAHFQKWLERDKQLSVFTLANTSYGMNDIQAVHGLNRFLFGEWDYCRNWPQDPSENAALYERHITSVLSAFDPEKPMPFRTAYTVPVVDLTPEDMRWNAACDQTVSHLQLSDPLIERIEPRMDDPDNCFCFLAGAVESLSPLYENGSHEIAESILSLGCTMTGLAKHMHRLLAGRFEQDLYAYLRPVFLYALKITKSHGQALYDMYQRYQEAAADPSDAEKQDYARGISTQISLLLSDYVQGVSDLLSHLQHLFSILSVSPHTFLETYGSNMRSLAAACKILIAYQGISYCLDREYGDLLCTREGNLLRSYHAILVLPYRNISTNNRLLFPLSDPEYRISAIQIDFTKMFRVPETLFMLLHECAHQLVGGKLRMKRADHYVRAVMLELVGEAFGAYMMDGTAAPEWLKDSELDQAQLRVDGATRREVEELIRESQRSIASELAKKASADYGKYCRFKKGIVCDKLLENKMASYITNQLKLWLHDFFGNSAWKKTQGQESLLYFGTYQIFWQHWYLAHSALETMEEDDPIRQLALWWERYYYVPWPDGEDIPKLDSGTSKRISNCVQKACRVIFRRCDDVCDELIQVFSDIFCDVFASKMLSSDGPSDLEMAKEYLQWFYNPKDPQQNWQMKRAMNLARACAVLDCCYGIRKKGQVLDLLAEIRLNEAELATYKRNPEAYIGQSSFWQEVSSRLDRVNDALYFMEIKAYAQECAEEMEERLRDSPNLRTIQAHLRMMRSTDVSKVLDGVCYFWQESTMRARPAQEEQL